MSCDTTRKDTIKPHIDYLADIHSRVYFCRSAALVRLKNGLDKLACRDYGDRLHREHYDLYLDGVPLVKTHIPDCGSCGTLLSAGYGDGLINQKNCLAVRDKINAEYDGMKSAVQNIAPIIGLLKSGEYMVADFDLFPVRHESGNCAPDYFWDIPKYNCYRSELHFRHMFVGGWDEKFDAPVFLAPSQRASLLDIERVNYYRERIKVDEKFPRAVALYLNGGVALLLDGHHKAAACAAEGIPVKTLVIFPMDDVKRLKTAVQNGNRLYFHHTKQIKGVSAEKSLAIKNGQGELLGNVSYLQRMKKILVVEKKLVEVDWGKAPDELYTSKYKNYPKCGLLSDGTMIPPDQIRTLIEQEMAKFKGTHDMNIINHLRNYAKLFPDSKWLSEAERIWLNRDDDDFVIYNY